MRIPVMITRRPRIFGIRRSGTLNLVRSLLPAAVAILLGRYALSMAMGRIRMSGEDFVGEVAT